MLVNTQTVGINGTIILGAGTYIRLLSCPNAVDVVLMQDGQPFANLTQVTTGLAYESRDEEGDLRPFGSVKISSAAAQTIQYAVGYGELRFDVANGTVSLVKPSTINTATDVVMVNAAKTAILAANTARRRAMITNLAAGAATLRIGDAANVAATRGIPVAPGETITLETTAAISGWNPGGVSQNVAVLEEAD